MSRERITVSMSPELAKGLDRARGDVSRSRFIASLIEKAVVELANDHGSRLESDSQRPSATELGSDPREGRP